MKAFRFWLVYTLAWLPYAISYVGIFLQQGSQLSSAIVDALVNVISAALLGLAVLWLCRRLPWSRYKRPWFFPLHLALAVAYAAAWVTAVSLAFSVLISLRDGRLTFMFLQSYALQWEFFSGLMIYATLASLSYVLQISAHLREEERKARETRLRAARAEALHARAELSALRAKLNPHFLFNTLHTLMALTRDNRAEAEAAIEKFSSMLRYVLRQGEVEGYEAAATQTTFADEWEFVKSYLTLEQLRLGERLTVETKIHPDAFEALVPPLSLQPLVENAIKHAVAPRATGGSISITAAMADEDLVVIVRDDGRGATEDELRSSSGLGLQLISRTLKTQYDGRARFSIETSPGNGFTVRLEIPQNTKEPITVPAAYAY